MNQEILDELKRLGYLPPQCTGVHIEMEAGKDATATMTAIASNDLLKWVLANNSCERRLVVVEPTPEMTLFERPLVYLACPYSHPKRTVRFERFMVANRAAARLMVMRSELVFSPVSHSHPVCEAVVDDETRESQSWGYWERFDRAILSICRKLYVLPLAGWKESVGVQAEIVIAQQMGIPVEILPDVFCAGPEPRDTSDE